jgi:hypothetical protein
MEYAGRRLNLEAGYAQVWKDHSSWTDLPSEMVVRIEMSHCRRFFDVTRASVIFAVGGPEWACEDNPGPTPVCLAYTSAVISPVAIAFAAASAPFALAAEGVCLLIPPKVYEIVH